MKNNTRSRKRSTAQYQQPSEKLEFYCYPDKGKYDNPIDCDSAHESDPFQNDTWGQAEYSLNEVKLIL